MKKNEFLLSIFQAIFLWGILASAPGISEGSETLDYDFPGYPDLVYLCGGQLLGSPGRKLQEIHWKRYSSKSAPQTLIHFYRQKLGSESFQQEGEGGLWRISKTEPSLSIPQVLRVLRIDPAKKGRGSSACQNKTPFHSKSIMEISQGFFLP